MGKKHLFLIFMEELKFDEETVLNYTSYISRFINYECKKICDNRLFMNYELEDLKFNGQVELCKALRKFKGITYGELISYSRCIINNYICDVTREKLTKVTSKDVIYYKDVGSKNPESLFDEVYYNEHGAYQDPIERYIVYDPIPKQVKARLKPQYREILDLILRFKMFPIDDYCKINNIKRRSALRKKERLAKVLVKEMNKWKETHRELARDMGEVFEYCK